MRSIAVAVALASIVGCAAPRPEGPPRPRPALLSASDLPAVRAAILALEGGSVSFGRPDGTDAPFLILLPPPANPNEGRNLGTPTVYDIVIGPEGCYLDRRSDSAVIALDDVECQPFDDGRDDDRRAGGRN